MKSTSLADERQAALYQDKLRTKHPMEFPTTVFIYIYITTLHQPSTPIQECRSGAFFEMKGYSIHHSIMNRTVSGGMMPSAHNGNG